MSTKLTITAIICLVVIYTVSLVLFVQVIL